MKIQQKAMRIKTEMKKIKCTPKQLKKRIAVFYEEYNLMQPIIKEKLKVANGENRTRLLNFIKDVEVSKKMIDYLAEPYKEGYKASKLKSIYKKALMPLQIKRFHLLLKHSYSMSIKYKKENCDINNFEV